MARPTFLISRGSAGAALDQIAPNASHRAIDFDCGAALPPFGASFDLFGDGSVTLVPGGGHTKEDVMVLLALPNGPALLAGDAVVHRDWLNSDDVQRIAVDPDRAAEVRNQVRALIQDRRTSRCFQDMIAPSVLDVMTL